MAALFVLILKEVSTKKFSLRKVEVGITLETEKFRDPKTPYAITKFDNLNSSPHQDHATPVRL